LKTQGKKYRLRNRKGKPEVLLFPQRRIFLLCKICRIFKNFAAFRVMSLITVIKVPPQENISCKNTYVRCADAACTLYRWKTGK
jgi:hypothetical protein